MWFGRNICELFALVKSKPPAQEVDKFCPPTSLYGNLGCQRKSSHKITVDEVVLSDNMGSLDKSPPMFVDADLPGIGNVAHAQVPLGDFATVPSTQEKWTAKISTPLVGQNHWVTVNPRCIPLC